jgi:hypothetical protein
VITGRGTISQTLYGEFFVIASFPSPLRLSVGALALAALSACSRDRAETPDSTLAQDLELATQTAVLPTTFGDTAMTASPAPAPVTRKPEAPKRSPTPRPTPVAERPRVSEPRPEPPPTPVPEPTPAPRSTAPAIAAGTSIAMTIGDRVCTASSKPGDKFMAKTMSSVVGENGAVIPAGTPVVIEIASVARGEKPEDTKVSFRVRAIVENGSPIPVTGATATADSLEKTRTAESKGTDKKKVIGGAIAGAILGQMIGKDTKGTVIGAAAGAAAGTAAAAVTARYEACVPSGSTLRFTLAEPLVLAGK